jgi:serine/threonine protein kinase
VFAAINGCLTHDTILEFVEGKACSEVLAKAESHLDRCADCRAVVAELANDRWSPQRSTMETRPARQVHGSSPIRHPREAWPHCNARTALNRGEKVDRYVVGDVIGMGGMGIVYAAHDSRLKRKVALKVMRTDRRVEVEDLPARLLREARAMARLSDPNVVVVHDLGTFREQVFVAMEFVDGVTLREWQAERSVGDVLLAYVEAGRGLAAAHRAQLVHRDFKPENVLVDRKGRVRVTDFGLARPATLERPAVGTSPGRQPAGTRTEVSVGDWALSALATETGVVAGTPAYMAPEQFLGQPTDARTDQFSFCIALYEAVFRLRPFDADTPDDLALVVTQGKLRPPPKTVVPEKLSQVLARGLKVSPEQRYPSMEELLVDLSSCIEQTTTQLDRWKARRKSSARGMAAIGMTLGVVGLVLLGRRLFTPEQGPPPVQGLIFPTEQPKPVVSMPANAAPLPRPEPASAVATKLPQPLRATSASNRHSAQIIRHAARPKRSAKLELRGGIETFPDLANDLLTPSFANPKP